MDIVLIPSLARIHHTVDIHHEQLAFASYDGRLPTELDCGLVSICAHGVIDVEANNIADVLVLLMGQFSQTHTQVLLEILEVLPLASRRRVLVRDYTGEQRTHILGETPHTGPFVRERVLYI